LVAFTFGSGTFGVAAIPGVGAVHPPTANLLSLGCRAVSLGAGLSVHQSRRALIGANRATPSDAAGSVMAIVLPGERLQLFHLIGAVVLTGVFAAARKPKGA
jgi:hypothetical protein